MNHLPVLLLLYMASYVVTYAEDRIFYPIRPSPPSPGPGPPLDDLQQSCGNDINHLCPGVQDRVWQLYCLYEWKVNVSTSCSTYLGSTTLGACDTDAQEYCGRLTLVKDITLCLWNHSTVIQEDCLVNLHNAQQDHSPMQEQIARFRHALWAVSLLAGIIIVLLLCVVVWALLMLYYQMYLEQSKVLSYTSEELRSKGQIVKLVKARAAFAESRMAQEESLWTLSFHHVSYWAGTSENQKQILHEISGQCKAHELTAIMGPSGSGKTTLLNLIAGQMFRGSFAGYRIINGVAYDNKTYDKIMRSQGYVPQVDSLQQSLTVWQTLAFAAMLRLPDHMSAENKLCRAALVMEELGLASVAHTCIGSIGGLHSDAEMKGISGGQRRLLSIALELLVDPSILLLDEPTSGLDATSTLRIVEILKQVTIRATIAFTIHQPRPEVFAQFDSLILLGRGGWLAYCGPSRSAVNFLCVASGRPSPGWEVNPGDLLLDLLAPSDNNSQDREAREAPQYLYQHFQTSDEYKTLVDDFQRAKVQQLSSAPSSICPRVMLSSGRRDYFRANTDEEDNSIEMRSLTRTDSPVLSSLPSVLGLEEEDTAESQLLIRDHCPCSWHMQLWLLFGRKWQASISGVKTLILSNLQTAAVAATIAITFSYHVSTHLEQPYQVLLLLSFISMYAMILQYLQMIPEYQAERWLLFRECCARLIAPSAYVVSSALMELLRGLGQCCLLLAVLYGIHPLNPDAVNRWFCFVCLVIGVCAWQSLVSCCSLVTDSLTVANTFAFLLLGSGTLFGGLLVRRSKLPGLFQPFYYVSIPAITQRALLVNDFECCYLTATCNSVAEDLHLPLSGNGTGRTHGFCPPGLQFTGDGSDAGNLGRLFLLGLDLQTERPFLSLVALLVAMFAFRALAVAVIAWRMGQKEQLVALPRQKDTS